MRTRDLALLLLINVVWALNFPAAKLGLEQFPPLLFTGLRFALLLALLFPLLRPVPGQTVNLLLTGLFMGILHYSLMFAGLTISAGVSSAAIAVQLYVPFSTLLAVLFLGERVAWKRSLGMLLAFCGVVVIGFDPDVLSRLDGLLLIVGAALTMAIANIYVSRLGRHVKPLALQAWVALLATPGLLLLSWLFEQDQYEAIRGADAIDWAMVAYSTLGASLVGHGLLAFLLARYPISAVTPPLLLTPLLAVLFGVTLSGDRLTPALIAGGSVTLLGVLIILLRTAKR